MIIIFQHLICQKSIFISIIFKKMHRIKNCYIFEQALGVFGLCQIFAFIEYVRARLSKEYFETLLKAVLMTVFSGVVIVGIILSITGECLN